MSRPGSRFGNQLAFLHLCQTLHEINPRARSIQREKDDDCRLLVRQGEPGDHMNQEAFSICPSIIQLPQQEQDVLELTHCRLAPDRRSNEGGRPASERHAPHSGKEIPAR